MRILSRIIFFVVIALPDFSGATSSQYQADRVQTGIYPNSLNESPQKSDLKDLPLLVLPATVESTLPMFVFVSGDGGWNTFNESLCKYVTDKGLSVVALNSQKYFWGSRTPEETAEDMATVVEFYQKLWRKDRFVLAGYSFGANIVPFLANRFPVGIKKCQSSAILISPDRSCDFEIHLSDMLNLDLSKGKYDVIQEIQKCSDVSFLAIFGSDESTKTQQAFRKTSIKVEILQGNHHFDRGVEALGDSIVAEVKRNQ